MQRTIALWCACAVAAGWTVATEAQGIDDLAGAIADHRAYLTADGGLARRRAERLRDEVRAIVVARLAERAAERCRGAAFDALVDAVAARDIDPYTAATRLLDD